MSNTELTFTTNFNTDPCYTFSSDEVVGFGKPVM